MVVENSDVIVGAGCGNTELQSANSFVATERSECFAPDRNRAFFRPFSTAANVQAESGAPRPLHRTRHKASSQAGSYSTIRAGSSSPSQAAAGASNTFQLLDDRSQTLRTFHLMVRRDLLPGQQEAHEVGAGDRLDLLSQTIQRVTVNSRQQATRTPLSFSCCRA